MSTCMNPVEMMMCMNPVEMMTCMNPVEMKTCMNPVEMKTLRKILSVAGSRNSNRRVASVLHGTGSPVVRTDGSGGRGVGGALATANYTCTSPIASLHHSQYLSFSCKLVRCFSHCFTPSF